MMEILGREDGRPSTAIRVTRHTGAASGLKDFQAFTTATWDLLNA